jgi:uncharacterized protein YndB with AHSA1/START domain
MHDRLESAPVQPTTGPPDPSTYAAAPTDRREPVDPSPTRGSATVRIDAPAEAAFAHLTDLTKLPELSPENVRCEFLEPSDRLEVGARFRGHNKARDYEWHADCVVTEFTPGRSFAYEVPPDYEHATVWSYLVEPDGDGCVVTESFHAPLLELPEIYPGTIEGRRDQLQRGCETTLANLKAALEDR